MVAQRLFDQIANHAFGFGVKQIQRIAGAQRLGLQCQQPYLRSIAMGHDQRVPKASEYRKRSYTGATRSITLHVPQIEDRELLLVAQGNNNYAAEMPALSHEARRLILEDPAGSWRIAGNLDKSGRAASLDSSR